MEAFLFMNKNFYIKIFFIFFLFSLNNIKGVVVGSDSSVGSAQSFITFPAAENLTNRIANYAYMRNGFQLQDSSTTCSYDSIFPVSGIFSLNGGKLYLNRSLVFDNIFGFGTGGYIFANGYSFYVPMISSSSSAYLGGRGGLVAIDNYDTGSNVISLCFSRDSTGYIAVGNDGASNNLKVLRVDSLAQTVTLTNSFNITAAVNCVSWNYEGDYLAVGIASSGSYELGIFYLNVSNGDFSLTYSVELGSDVNALTWTYTGNYLAVGTNDDIIRVYNFSDGKLNGTPASISLPNPAMQIQRGAMSWCSSDYYFAVGSLVTDISQQNLLVYSFNGTTISLDAGVNITGVTGAATAVKWLPHFSDIVVGLNTTAQTQRVYRYSVGTLTEFPNSLIGETSPLYSVDSSDGVYFSVALLNGYLKTYDYNPINGSVLLTDEIDLGVKPNYAVAMCGCGDRTGISIGGYDDIVYAYRLSVADFLYFQNAEMQINTDIIINKLLYASGYCDLDMAGHKLTFEPGGRIYIMPNSRIYFKDLVLENLAGINIKAIDQSCEVIFDDCTISLTANMLIGFAGISLRNDVFITGSGNIIYAATRTSTIEKNSRLMFDKNSGLLYMPQNANRDLLYMTDKTSEIILNGGSLYSTRTGLRLTRGSLVLDGKSTLSSMGIAVSEAICFGDGSEENNLDIYLDPAAQVDVYGRLEYQNTY